VIAQALDSSDVEAQAALVDLAKAEFGRLDILVANSGGPPPGGLKDLTPEQWRKAADLLIVGPAFLLRTALPLLKASPAPRFFVVTSSSTVTPVAGLALSNTFRPGLVGLIKSLTEELAEENVCCHSIAPGRIDTDRLATVFTMQGKKQNKSAEEMRDAALKAIPAARLGEPADLGNLVAYLSSPLASYLRGGNWLVDGGFIRVV
jgi:3-oxoacyl-[acyl-carrier protein] reductase